MLLEIGGQNIELTDTLRLYVERRVHFALSRFAPRIKKAKIHIQDTNRPRREPGKTCQITVILPTGNVLVTDTQDDLYVAIDRAAERAGQAVERELARRRVM